MFDLKILQSGIERISGNTNMVIDLDYTGTLHVLLEIRPFRVIIAKVQNPHCKSLWGY